MSEDGGLAVSVQKLDCSRSYSSVAALFGDSSHQVLVWDRLRRCAALLLSAGSCQGCCVANEALDFNLVLAVVVRMEGQAELSAGTILFLGLCI